MIFQGKGGANTKTGLAFEGKTELSEFLAAQNGYKVENGNVFYNEEYNTPQY